MKKWLHNVCVYSLTMYPMKAASVQTDMTANEKPTMVP